MPTLTWAWLVGVVLFGTTMQSCATSHEPPPSLTESEQAAMQRVFAADDRLGAIRNAAPNSMPIAAAVASYASALGQIDLAGTPPAFARAFKTHIAAWDAMAEHLERYPTWRGEMHDVFDMLATESNPDRAEFQQLLERVWATWNEVEVAAQRSDSTE